MTTLFVAMEDTLLAVRGGAGKWTVEEHLQGKPPRCVAVDPTDTDGIYAGTDGNGLWRSPDGGHTWSPAGQDIAWGDITAAAVGPNDAGSGGTVYVGTEPSAVFRSTDRGETWKELESLTKLSSAPTWSFPPRPETHHVRWIAVDPHDARRLYVAIEAGALVRSQDGGDTWLDRVPGGPYDTHTLALHPEAPGRLYSAAGDGYFESDDAGRSWEEIDAGLHHGYLFGVAVDPSDPETVVVSSASGPGRAYWASRAASFLYARRGNQPWTAVGDGFPAPEGTTISVLATHRHEPHVMYAANNRGIFRSEDAGRRWNVVDITWPRRLLEHAVHALAVTE